MGEIEVLSLDEPIKKNKSNKKKNNTIKTIIIVFYLLLIAFLSVYVIKDIKIEKPTPEIKIETVKAEDTIEKYSFSFIGIGDALIHDGVYWDARTYKYGSDGYMIYDFSKMFGYLKEMINGYDLKYYNQETMLGGKNIGITSYPCFNSPDEVGEDMIKAGFNVVSLATNHSLDRGIDALKRSAHFFHSKENVIAVGAYESREQRDNIPTYEVNGITYAILNYTYGTNGIPVPSGYDYAVNLWPYANVNHSYANQVKKDIEQVRDKVDVLMVAMHWGTEYQVGYTNNYQQTAAKFLADLGVDVIIGTHPHVVQPVTFIDDTLVIYSLGNFISSQTDDMDYAKRIGGVVAFTVNKTINGDDVKVTVDDVKTDLVFTYHTSSHTKYNVIPFNKLNNSLFYNYQNYRTKYLKYMNPNNDSRIQNGFLK